MQRPSLTKLWALLFPASSPDARRTLPHFRVPVRHRDTASCDPCPPPPRRSGLPLPGPQALQQRLREDWDVLCSFAQRPGPRPAPAPLRMPGCPPPPACGLTGWSRVAAHAQPCGGRLRSGGGGGSVVCWPEGHHCRSGSWSSFFVRKFVGGAVGRQGGGAFSTVNFGVDSDIVPPVGEGTGGHFETCLGRQAPPKTEPPRAVVPAVGKHHAAQAPPPRRSLKRPGRGGHAVH